MLTEKQRAILLWIDGFQKTNGYTPSQDEIARGMGYAGQSSVQGPLRALETKGYIRKAERPDGQRLMRGIIILKMPQG